MALKKVKDSADAAPEAAAANEEIVANEPVVETEAAVAVSLAADPAAEEEAAAAEAAKVPAPGASHLKVLNLRKTSFRQPSTGLWIKGGEEKYLENDGWLKNHVGARLLALVED